MASFIFSQPVPRAAQPSYFRKALEKIPCLKGPSYLEQTPTDDCMWNAWSKPSQPQPQPGRLIVIRCLVLKGLFPRAVNLCWGSPKFRMTNSPRSHPPAGIAIAALFSGQPFLKLSWSNSSQLQIKACCWESCTIATTKGIQCPPAGNREEVPE